MIEFGYDKEKQEFLVFDYGDIVGNFYFPLDEEDLRAIQHKIKNGTYFVIYENVNDELGDYGDD